MRTQQLGMAVGLVVGVLAPASARSAPAEPPKNVDVEASYPHSGPLTKRAAMAERSGTPRVALALAREAIAANERDPWARYEEATALWRLGQIDAALTSFLDAERRFPPAEWWGRSIAMYDGAHVLAEAGRCEEATREYQRYAAFVRERDPASADLATRYAAKCRPPVVSTAPSAAPPTPILAPTPRAAPTPSALERKSPPPSGAPTPRPAAPPTASAPERKSPPPVATPTPPAAPPTASAPERKSPLSVETPTRPPAATPTASAPERKSPPPVATPTSPAPRPPSDEPLMPPSVPLPPGSPTTPPPMPAPPLPQPAAPPAGE
jgi:hypothetical protein